MRHPAAPTIIAALLGFLVFMLMWAWWRADGHHEGNPDVSTVPRKRTVESSSGDKPMRKDGSGACQNGCS